jgi:excisionase family DNA binding protein
MNFPRLHQPDLFFPATVVPTTRADGAFLVIPGKPVPQDEELSVGEVARILRCSPSRVRQLARAMGARQARARGKLRIPASEVARWKDRRA